MVLKCECKQIVPKAARCTSDSSTDRQNVSGHKLPGLSGNSAQMRGEAEGRSKLSGGDFFPTLQCSLFTGISTQTQEGLFRLRFFHIIA